MSPPSSRSRVAFDLIVSSRWQLRLPFSLFCRALALSRAEQLERARTDLEFLQRWWGPDSTERVREREREEARLAPPALNSDILCMSMSQGYSVRSDALAGTRKRGVNRVYAATKTRRSPAAPLMLGCLAPKLRWTLCCVTAGSSRLDFVLRSRAASSLRVSWDQQLPVVSPREVRTGGGGNAPGHVGSEPAVCTCWGAPTPARLPLRRA